MARTHRFALPALLSAAVLCAACDRPVDAGPPVAELPTDPWVTLGHANDPAAAIYASCASCHMADASGRTDGTVPRLAGQRAAVVAAKLERLQAGAVTLPVMTPFARALAPADVGAVARYVADLPVPAAPAPATAGTAAYTAACAACHGLHGEGSDALLAPRLCGQHAAYLQRRMAEVTANTRGDADLAMAAIVASLDDRTRRTIAAWLATGRCGPGVGDDPTAEAAP